ncbi:cysteinyl-tRNA synthetase [Desulfonatronospira thiodismutans ASO3-1]|uniref:Cysteine--tRNA ligase n=1 Tax=Desulfonatronospira thiodismutans ASO3-1 TaxID=555779 RepID=D6SMF2_9BACT|nr:cysteine--tRNA ligase [Desulfonatronospira thiodismutans]EFI35863.1 cysteinyl-tRNA synthetase [Desulfonatronospira thiodismutans ASO3-1]
MLIYNTLHRAKEKFVPLEPGKVRMYVCGITAYDYCHIGHARSCVVFDVLVRYLRYLGYHVSFVRNFTDVDDKIIKRAEEEGLDSDQVAEKYIEAFYLDMDELNVLKADVEPRATRHIEEMIQVTKSLLDKGFAYITSGKDIYFRVRRMPRYGQLSGRNIEELQSGSRIAPDEEKEDPLDFALWKTAKPGEPSWDSPWGAGRPGWHLECTAMSEKYLGIPFDIHGGGQDLAFPHHENEKAQSEAAFDREFVKYWVHNGFVRVDSEKMSKSLGNFITIRDIMKDFHGEVLRFFLLTKHYRSPLDYSDGSLEETEKALKRVYWAKTGLQKELQKEKWSKGQGFPEASQELQDLASKWDQAMQDDLNTAEAVGYVFGLVRLANRMLEDKTFRKSEAGKEIIQQMLGMLEGWGDALGVFQRSGEEFLEQLKLMRCNRLDIDPQTVQEMVLKRQQARKDKDFETADNIREELTAKGIEVMDTPEGPRWDFA